MDIISVDVRATIIKAMGMLGQYSLRIEVSYEESACGVLFSNSLIPSKKPKMVFIFSTGRKRVVMTGFSNFQDNKSNPSWEGVKCMNGKEIENKYDITLFRKEIAVDYNKVDTQMWQYYQPHLTIHVGLNKAVQSFVLHKMANKQGDHTLDDDEDYGPDVVSTTLNVDKICSKFNNCKRFKLKNPTLLAESSDDAGKYLAEYIYYYISPFRSNRNPTLFVHVPFNKYTSQQLANGLERILELCLNLKQ